ncbi:MAG: hypothetical protein ABIH72_04225 [archaeon]
MEVIKEVIAPVRIDFAGGTTDIRPFTFDHGGAVLNATINHYVHGKLLANDKGVGLSYSANVPTSSGLGTSGVMNLVWLALISQHKDKIQLAESVYNLEQATGLVGGKQDQYAAAVGGINFFEFKGDSVRVIPLNLDKKTIHELEEKLVLVYTGAHYSGMLNKFSIDNLLRGKNTNNLLRIKEIAYQMKNALLQKKLLSFAELMDEETKQRKKLHKSIVPKSVDDLIEKGKKHGAISAKVCGAGGGGSVLFFTEDRKKMEKVFKKKIINFKFEFKGLRFLS